MSLRTMFQPSLLAATALLSALILGGCGTSRLPRVYQGETFATESPFQYYSSRNPEGACEISRRALLSQGYQVDEAKPLNMRGEKYFQPSSEHVTRLSITLVCLPSSLGAVVYASAQETYYELKSTGSSTGLSVAGIGSVSLPWGAEKGNLAKVGEATVTAPEFYQRLFDLIKTLDG